jgi:hypothetical protein
MGPSGRTAPRCEHVIWFRQWPLRDWQKCAKRYVSAVQFGYIQVGYWSAGVREARVTFWRGLSCGRVLELIF